MGQYVGKKGDTLAKLARKYGVSRKKLRELNPDIKFGKSKKKGGKGWKGFKGETLKLGKGIGVPKWKAEILQDPKYAAFERNFQLDKDKLRSDFIEFKNRQARDLARQEPVWAEDLRRAYQGIDRGADARGMYRSGQRLLERGRTKSVADMERQRYIDLQGEEREQARRNKREAIAGLKRQKMEEKLAARERLTMRDANIEYGYGV